MRFTLGQKFVSKTNPALFAEVAQLDDEGRAAASSACPFTSFVKLFDFWLY
jgi:hypothetical protein